MAENEQDVSIDAPLISSHNDYLLDQTSVIKSRTIPWEGYQKASLINEQELSLIRQFQPTITDKQQYATLFISLLNKLSRVDTLQSILVLIDDFIQQDGVAQLFLSDPAVFTSFNKLLTKEDEYIQLKAAKILIFLLGESNSSYPADPTELLTWVVFQLASTNTNVVDISLQFLQSLLAINLFRKEFVKQADGVMALLTILNKTGQTPQVQYQAIYSIWLLSFVKEIAADLEKCFTFNYRKYHVIPVLRDIAKSAIKEKVVRIAIATFKNMLINAPAENIIPMLGHKLLGAIETLSVRKWSDPEITEDLMYVREELSHHVASLSTFDEYSTEVLSRRLEWSPPHLSEIFWKQNSNKLNDNQFELVKTLVDITKTSEDPVVLAVAAYDLGQYCKYANNAKNVLVETGGKTAVMGLMAHKNSDVQYQALAAVQKFMMNSW
ncbi:H(+)-transporting V1 sector ATPase subunit H [Terramyces sp. JEL0728]|nr:H(+)-transporting V1 sector ATPase subunit H [Terramyces sp. JEL0728]